MLISAFAYAEKRTTKKTMQRKTKEQKESIANEYIGTKGGKIA
jgi:hypothetical protein